MTEALSDEDARLLKVYVEQAVRAIKSGLDGEPFFIAMKVAFDPHIRRRQYQGVMQVLAQNFGPREGEDLQQYFDLSLIMH